MNTKTYFGFGIAPSMFPTTCTIGKCELSVEQVRDTVAAGIIPCLNPSHKATIEVMETRFGLHVEIPAKAPSVLLDAGESLVVLTATGLPRLEGRHEYTPEEVEGAKFSFALFTVSE